VRTVAAAVGRNEVDPRPDFSAAAREPHLAPDVVALLHGDDTDVGARHLAPQRAIALLDGLVERERQELEHLRVEVSLSSVMRKLIRRAAKASAVYVAGVEAAEPVAPTAGRESVRSAPPPALGPFT
jgi:hypothetical protein